MWIVSYWMRDRKFERGFKLKERAEEFKDELQVISKELRLTTLEPIELEWKGEEISKLWRQRNKESLETR